MSTVLIVDDHAGFRSIATMVLEGSGYEVVGEAADGAEAIAQCERLRPEIVLLDVDLPDMNGFEVARRLAERPDSPAVVLVSSRRASDFGASLEKAPARGFIAKNDLSVEAIAELVE